MTTTKILWFSRHEMTTEQTIGLINKFENIEITQINGSPQNVHVPFEGNINGNENVETLASLKEIIKDFDVLAVVLPIHLQQQLLTVSVDKPVIQALNGRVLIKSDDGSEDKVQFVHQKWERLVKIEVVKEDFC
jgi:hypothetical protein